MPQAVGEWDFYIVLAERYHWPPPLVGGLDPEFLDELAVYLRAQYDHDDLERRRATRQGRRRR